MAYFDPKPPRDEKLFTSPPRSTDVLIVGAGPVGLFAAFALARHSISSVVVERHAHRLGQPKAHAINARSLEIFRQLGLDTDQLRAEGVSAKEGSVVHFMTVLNGEKIGMLPYERQDVAARDVTPEPLFNIAQPILEEYLQKNALHSGFVSIHRSQEWVEYHDAQTGNRLVSTIRDRDQNSLYSISSRFIIGADGVNSTVRAEIPGLSLNPVVPGSTPRKYVSIHFTADLRAFVSDDLAQLYFFLDPSTNHASLIGYGNPSWVYARPLLPDEKIETFTPEECRKLINVAIGETCSNMSIHSAQIWSTFPAICSSYADPTCRVFLAGDSAHQFPPQGGLGVNTGIGDIQNLIWKLAYAFRKPDEACKSFLDTYSSERIPVAKANAIQSSVNEGNMRLLEKECLEAIGKATEGGQRRFDLSHFQDPTVQQPIQEAIERNRDHFDSLGLQLGPIYGKLQNTEPTEPCWVYRPSFEKGARLPHAWICKKGKGGAYHDAISILDLTDYAKFTVWTTQKTLKFPSGMDNAALVVSLSDWECPKEWEVSSQLDHKLLVVRPDQHILGYAESVDEVVDLIQSYHLGN